MAFNPFTWFRKNQKALFAGLLILCMIVFIGQFGAGDPFQVAINYFGSSRAAGPEITQMFRRAVHLDEVEQVKRNREMANGFLLSVIQTSHDRVRRNLLATTLKSSSPDDALSGVRELVTRLSEYPRQLQMAAFQGREAYTLTQFRIQEQLQNDLSILESIAARDRVKNNAESLETLRRVATMAGFLVWAFGERTSRSDMYMGGSTARIEDRLDFLVWKKQADNLGINLTDADVLNLVEIEAAGDEELFSKRLPPHQQKVIVDAVFTSGEGPRMRPADLIDALRQEFRVAQAQTILLGIEPGARGYRNRLGATASPAVGTPQEFFSFFKEQRTTSRVAFLPVPASDFLSRINNTPSQEELRTLFDRFRDKEPSPFSRDPGFKEPRRILVEFVSASHRDPYYRDLADKQTKALLAQSDPKNRLGTALATLTMPPLAAVGIAFDPIQTEYERDLANEQPWISSDRDSLSTLEQRARGLHYGSVLQPTPAAALFLGMGGVNPLVGLSSLYGAASQQEIKSSVTFNAGLLLRGGGIEDSLGRAALALASSPPVPSRAVLQPQLLAALRERIAQTTLDNNLRTLASELAKFRGRSGAGKDYLARAVKEYNFELKRMDAPKTREALQELTRNKALGQLEPLREAIAAMTQQNRPETFVEFLFQGNDAYEPQLATTTEPKRQEFLYWRAEDLPARERNFEDVRGEVLAAWKLEQARHLAARQAETLRNEVNKQKFNAADALRFLREKGPVFELDNIAQLLPPREVLAMPNVEYRPYQVPEESADLMRYPPTELAKQVLQIKEIGQARVIADQPVKTFYVAVLLDRSIPTQAEFTKLYARTPRDTLYNRFLSQRREQFRKNLLEQLRAEAAGGRDKLERDGRFKLTEAGRRSESVEVQ